MDMTKPGVQKPHCEPWLLASRACTGCRPLLTEPSPSTVVTAQPSTLYRGARQALTARCLAQQKGRQQGHYASSRAGGCDRTRGGARTVVRRQRRSRRRP